MDKVKYDTKTVKITYKGETRNIPKRYLPDSLKGKDRQKQIKSIFEEKDRPKTKVKDRKSSWTVQFDKEYGDKLDSMKGKKNYHENSKDLVFRYSDILQAEGALERIKDSAQSVENFVNSLQRNFKREE